MIGEWCEALDSLPPPSLLMATQPGRVCIVVRCGPQPLQAAHVVRCGVCALTQQLLPSQRYGGWVATHLASFRTLPFCRHPHVLLFSFLCFPPTLSARVSPSLPPPATPGTRLKPLLLLHCYTYPCDLPSHYHRHESWHLRVCAIITNN